MMTETHRFECNWIKDVEALVKYRPGGYHPIMMGDVVLPDRIPKSYRKNRWHHQKNDLRLVYRNTGEEYQVRLRMVTKFLFFEFDSPNAVVPTGRLIVC